MLSVKKVAAKGISILGRSIAPAEQLAMIKSSGADREMKDMMRQCLIVAMHFQSSSKESLEKAKTIARKNRGDCEISSRAAAFTAATAVKLNKWNDVKEMLQLSRLCPPAISSSIRVKALSDQSKIDGALEELENILCLEEAVFSTENYCISDEALDSLCEAIKAQPESTEQMKRFRNLQRLITKYGRRTSKSIEDLLFSPIHFEATTVSPAISESEEKSQFVKSDNFDHFVRKIPYLKDNKVME